MVHLLVSGLERNFSPVCSLLVLLGPQIILSTLMMSLLKIVLILISHVQVVVIILFLKTLISSVLLYLGSTVN